MVRPVEITRLDLPASALREEAARTRDGAVVRRLLALALILEGHSRAEAARLTAWTVRPCATGCIATTPRAWQD